MALLYVDLLGMKAQWQLGGVEAARRRYREFGELVSEGLDSLPTATVVGGGVQSDAAALVFATTRDAVVAGRSLFNAAFLSGSSGRRTWIRGLICKHDWPPGAPLEKVRQLPGAPEGVFERHFHRPLLEAINLEQSGFRGQRLLIENSLVTPDLRQELALTVAGRPLEPFRRLYHSSYPPVLDAFQDVLWMLSGAEDDWQHKKLHMLNLLRWSSLGGNAELVQASETHLVFAQADAIRFGLANAPAWFGDDTGEDRLALWTRLCRGLAEIAKAQASP